LEKGEIMKVAISTDGQELGSRVSPIFGRCPYFLIVELDGEKIRDHEVVENTAMEKASGAGTEATQVVGEKDVDIVISGGIGPKAFQALKKWDIEPYEGEPGSVEDNITKFSKGDLKKIENPTRRMGAGSGG
jgi:predicted Fe-Mo cluster-binding NifX family protein